MSRAEQDGKAASKSSKKAVAPSLLVGRASVSIAPTTMSKPRSPTLAVGVQSRLEPLMLDLKVAADVLPRLLSEEASAEGMQRHLHRQDAQSTSRSTSATYAEIQNAWALFAALNDIDKNAFIKGVLSHCGSRQVEFICQELNLRLSTVSRGVGNAARLHTKDTHTRLTKLEFNRLAVDDFARTVPPTDKRPSHYWPADDTATTISGGGGGTDKDRSKLPINNLDKLSILPLSQPHPLPQVQHHKTTSMANTNMFLQLFDSKHSPGSFLSQIPHADVETVRQFAQFTATKCQKLQTILSVMNNVAGQVDLQQCSKCLLFGAAGIIESTWHTVYLVDNLRQVVVQASNWLPFGKRIPLNYVFGDTALDRGETISVCQAVSSEYYTDICHDFYEKEEIKSILSIPLVLENGRLFAIVEFINKAAVPGQSQFFDAEDEFLARSTVSTWNMLLREAKAETERMLYATKILNTLSKLGEANRDNLDLKQAAAMLAQTAIELVPMEQCYFVLFCRNTNPDEYDSSRDPDPRMICPEPSDALRTFIDSQVPSIRTDKKLTNIAHTINNTAINSANMDPRIRNLLIMPIFYDGQELVLGALISINKLPDVLCFNSQDESMLTNFASIVSLTIRRKLQLFNLSREATRATQEIQFLADAIGSTDLVFGIVDAKGKLLRLQNGHKLSLTATNDVTVEVAFSRENLSLLADIRTVLNGRKLRHCAEYAMRVPPVNSRSGGSVAARPASEGGRTVYVNYKIFPSGTTNAIVCIEEIKDEITLGALRARLFEPAVARSLMDSPLLLNGVSSDAALLLINIKDFLKTSASMSAEEMCSTLSKYYSIIKAAVDRYKGFVLSPSSDKVLCVFGLPISRVENNEARSCTLCALEIHKELAAFKKNLELRQVDIALNFIITATYGMIRAGITRCGRIMDYTIAGVPVQYIYTLSSLAKQYDTTLVIDQATFSKIRTQFDFREIDTVMGDEDQTEEGDAIYNVLGQLGMQLDDSTKTAYICYELGLTEYRQRNFDAALTYFRKTKSLVEDGPSAAMMKKCRLAIEAPLLTA